MKEEYTDVYFGNTMFWSFMFITILEFLSSNHRKPCKNTRKPSLKTSCTPPIPTAFQRLQPASRCSRRGATLWCCNLEVGSVTPHSSTVGETVVAEQPGGSPRWTTAGHHSAQELSSLCCIMHWSLSIFCGCQQIHVQVLKKKITKQCKLQDNSEWGKFWDAHSIENSVDRRRGTEKIKFGLICLFTQSIPNFYPDSLQKIIILPPKECQERSFSINHSLL